MNNYQGPVPPIYGYGPPPCACKGVAGSVVLGVVGSRSCLAVTKED